MHTDTLIHIVLASQVLASFGLLACIIIYLRFVIKTDQKKDKL